MKRRSFIEEICFLFFLLFLLFQMGCKTPNSNLNRPVNYIGTKNPTEAKEVGDIVFSDGSSIQYTDTLELTDNQKKSAISVIFYTAGDSRIGNRTLGIGLKQIKKAWAATNASGYNVTINTTEENGYTNLNIIKNNTDYDKYKYPAFWWVDNYSQPAENLENFSSAWYLPARYELDCIYKTKNIINDSINKIGNDSSLLCNDFYWSSSQVTSYNSYKTKAYTCDFSSGNWDNPDFNYKSSNNVVCAIRQF